MSVNCPRALRAPAFVIGLLLVSGCPGDGEAPPPSDASVRVEPPPGRDAAIDGGRTEPDAGRDGGLRITLDYRFDARGFFEDATRRRTLEAAAAAWGAILRDDFEPIPAGTRVVTRDPEHPDEPAASLELDDVIDDVLVFVGCDDAAPAGYARSNFTLTTSVSDAALAERLSARRYGPDFQPWTGWISFRCSEPWYFDATPDTDDDLPVDRRDFYSAAMHELGHVLGFGGSPAFESWVEGTTFTGPAAVTAYGGPVPLDMHLAHIEARTLSDDRTTLMDPGRELGERTPPTTLDIAFFADIGYELEDGGP